MREHRSVMEAQLEAARQLAQAKDAFIAGVSHELRTPLTSIYGFSEVLLESRLVDPNQALELIAVINSESAELTRMVEDLLTAARLDAEALTFDISDVALVREIEIVLEPFLRLGAEVPPLSTPNKRTNNSSRKTRSSWQWDLPTTPTAAAESTQMDRTTSTLARV